MNTLSKYILVPSLVGLVLGCLGTGCGTSTTIRPITIPVHYTGLDGTKPFTSKSGWKITLSKATVPLSFIRVHEQKEAVSKWLQYPIRLLQPVSVAWAHAGHEGTGGVLAELQWNKTLDLLNTEQTHLGNMQGFTGSYGEGELTFRKTDKLSLHGQATKAGKNITFEIELPLQKQEVLGISAQHQMDTATPMKLEIQLTKWFDLIDFSSFTKATGGQTATPDTPSSNILRKALFSNRNYKFTWAKLNQ